MAIHTGGDKRKGARADLMTGDRGNGSRSATAKTFRSSRRISPSMCCRPMSCASIPRTGSSFFTASSIARSPSAIGEGGKSFRELVRELEQDFPSDKIHEALKRLVDRRYVVPASRSSGGAVAAYWASLGLPPETAETKSPEMSACAFNRSTCRAQRSSAPP